MTNLTPTDIDQLQKELTARLNFESAVGRLLERFLEMPLKDDSQVFRAWRELLLAQTEQVSDCAFVEANNQRNRFQILGAARSDLFWRRLRMSNLGARLQRCLLNRSSLTLPLSCELRIKRASGKQLIFSPCGSGMHRGLIVVSTVNAIVSHVDTITSFVANMAEAITVHIEASRAQRAMAARAAHSVTCDILVAQLRLRSVLQSHLLRSNDRAEIEKAVNDLEDAQQGLDRARMLGVAADYQREVPLEDLLAELAGSLTLRGGGRILKAILPKRQGESKLQVRAAPDRLYYVLRDLSLGVWVLSGSDPKRPARLFLTNGGNKVKLQFSGAATDLPSGLSPTKLKGLLRDPSGFVVSAGRVAGGRGIGFDLPAKLIREMNGQIEQAVDRHGNLDITVQLPLVKPH